MTEPGLSILIPQYNQEVIALLERLEASIPNHIPYEVVVANDNDQASYPLTQEWLNTRGFRFIQNAKNLGRAKNRNQLAIASQYDLLLFMDEDMMPKNSACIERYHDTLQNNDVVVGGHIYEEQKPNSSYLLHWRYGSTIEAKASSKNEHKSFSSAVFGIKKSCFNSIKFNESIVDYGHEDSLFGASLEQHSYQIEFIDEPCYHLGLHTNSDFVERSRTAIQTLYQIEQRVDHPTSQALTRLQEYYTAKNRSGIGQLQLGLIQLMQTFWRWMAIQWSSVAALQLYKLSCYCQLKKEE
ncbi:MAG: glycosyltransferase [Bacteroidota bacterium]|nr:glycosyltransferase [Bacteroidota bacterium]